VIVVESESAGRVGVMVDELLGQQQVVVKSLEANYESVDGVSGATDAERLESIPAAHSRRFMTELPDRHARMNDELRSLIMFAPLNLLESWPMSGPPGGDFSIQTH
jgi:chemotaxis methyl-accepting protein methylase